MKRVLNPNWLAENWFQVLQTIGMVGGCMISCFVLYNKIDHRIYRLEIKMEEKFGSDRVVKAQEDCYNLRRFYALDASFTTN